MLGEDEEGAQDRAGVLREDVVLRHVHLVAAREKRGLEPHGRGARCAPEEPVGDRLELDDRHLHDALGVPVVALHEGFRSSHEPRGLVSQAPRELLLDVEDEPVLIAPRKEVQLEPEVAQKPEARLDRAPLALGDELGGLHLLDARREARRAGAPEEDLQVPQASGGLLEIGLERVGRVLELLVAAAEL